MQLKKKQSYYKETHPKAIEIETRANQLLEKTFRQLKWDKAGQHKTTE